MSESISELGAAPLAHGAVRRFLWSAGLSLLLLSSSTALQAKEPLELKGEDLAEGFNGVYQLAFSPDRKFLAIGSNKGIILWDLEKGKKLDTKFREADGTFHGLAFSPNGKLLVACNGPFTWVFDVASGKSKHTFKVDQADAVNAIAISPDGKILAVSGLRHSATLFDLETYEELAKLEGQKQVVALAFDKTGETLATASVSPFGSTIIWNVKKREKIKTLQSGFAMNNMVYSADGNTLVTAEAAKDYEGVVVWDVETGKQRVTYGGVKPKLGSIAFFGNRVALTPDGKTFLWTCGTIVGVLTDIDSGNEPEAVEGFKMSLNIKAMALSPDGKLLAIGGQKGVMIGEAPKKKKE